MVAVRPVGQCDVNGERSIGANHSVVQVLDAPDRRAEEDLRARSNDDARAQAHRGESPQTACAAQQMTRGTGSAVRVVTGITLLILSIDAARGQGFMRLLGAVEIAAAAAFCLSRTWRIGGVGLLAILGIAFTHHAIAGHFAASLLFAVLVVVLELAYERP